MSLTLLTIMTVSRIVSDAMSNSKDVGDL